MQKRPGAVDELFVDWGTTGATLGATIYDGASTVITSRTTGFVESPAGSGGYVLADFTFPDDMGTYRVRYDDDGGTAAVGHVAWEDLTITSSTGEPFDGDTYGTVDELFRLLKITNPTDAQTDAATRVLTMATGEVDSELGRDDDDPVAGWEISLATEVSLERAVELWRDAPFGLVDIGGDFGATHTSKNTWERYAHKLAPAKRSWGLALTSAQRQLAGMVANVQSMVEASDYEIAVWPGMLFNPSTTAIDIYPNTPFRDLDTSGFNDSGGYRWIVRARTGLNDLDSGQQILLDLMDDDSDNCLKSALEDDETLGGYATQVAVDEPTGFAAFRAPGEDGTMVGFTLEVLVMAAFS